MVNGSQCKISGAVGHAWGRAHAQWADGHVAALHVRGGLRMRSKRTTAWQLLTRSQIAIDRVSLLLVMSLCFWSLSISIPISLWYNVSPPDSRWTTTPPNRRVRLHLCPTRPTGPPSGLRTPNPCRDTGRQGSPPVGAPPPRRGPIVRPTVLGRHGRRPSNLGRRGTSGDDSSASSSRYFLGSGPAPRSRHRRRRRENTPSPSPQSSSSSASAVGLAPLSPAGGEPLTTLTGTGNIVAGITPTLGDLSPSHGLSGRRSFEVSLLISLSYWGNSQWLALRARTHVLKNVG